MSIKAYKYRIYANTATTKKLQWVLERCRELYNAALSERKDAYHMAGKSISYYEQKRDLVEIKESIRPEYQEIASHVLQDVILRVKRAYDNFFRRVENGEKPGYPRFQGRNRYDSFTYPDGAGWKLDQQKRPPEKTRKKRGSYRRKKAVQAVAKAHRKIRNQRQDFLHRQSRRLINRYQILAFEDLHTTNLIKRPKPKQDKETGQYLPNGAAAKAGLNKSIVDAGWSQFVQLCTCKAAISYD